MLGKTERIHSLDSLRAVMMLLGIVLHSTEPYSLGEDAFWPKDPGATHGSLNYIFGIIHIFRMPIFFMVAGFFASLLFYERGPRLMAKNRISRVVLPFAVFLLILHPILIATWDNTATVFGVTITKTMTTMTLFPSITYHLWFLYYLIFMTAISFVLATILKKAPALTKRITRSFEWFMKKRAVFIIVFAIVTFLMLVWIWDTWISTPLSFVPDIPILLAYSMFYFMGWILFKSKHLLDSFMKKDWLFTILAVVIFTARYFLRSYVDDVLYGLLNAIIVWFFIFGITGLFIRYTSNHSLRWRYISDSSYWVYLIHLPLTAFIPSLIVDWPLPAFVKFVITMIGTTIVCFATYHFLVRNSFIGKFLNGRKYPLKAQTN